jgi:hypothetical protein
MRLGWTALVWLLRTIAGAIIGQAALLAMHLCDFYPDRYLALKAAGLIKQPPADLLLWAQLGLTILFGAAALIAYEFVMHRLPAPAGTPTRRWRRPAKPKDVAPVPVLRRVVTADYDIPAKLQAIDEAIALLAGC